MLRRWHVLVMIAVVLLAICLAATAKLRATPKFDKIQAGMDRSEVDDMLGVVGIYKPGRPDSNAPMCEWVCDEGIVTVQLTHVTHWNENETWTDRVTSDEKNITRRGPLERLAWLAGWR